MASDQPGRPDTDLVTPVLTNLTDDQRKIMAWHTRGLRRASRCPRFDPVCRLSYARLHAYSRGSRSRREKRKE